MVFDRVLGNAVRFIPGSQKKLYLTFDDGPSIHGTEEVLKVLEKHQVKATFFVIANRAQQSKVLIQQIQNQKHQIGNHSLDHQYRPFFAGKKALLRWIQESEDLLSQQLGTAPVGFRSPAGVRTPELGWALKYLNIPLVLWKTRFFDTVFPWKKERALTSLNREKGGSIILLHDHQKPDFMPLFLDTLNAYIEYGKQIGFEFETLNREICSHPLNPNVD